MKRLWLGMILFFVTSIAVKVSASPVYLPESVKGIEKGYFINENLAKDIGFSGAFDYDHMYKRTLKESGKVKGDFYTGKLTVSLFNKVDLYSTLGQMVNASYSIAGSDAKISLANNFTWGLGAGATLFDWKEQGVKIFGDANYRTASEIDYKSLTTNGTTYSKSQFQSIDANAKWEEWQTALGVSKKFGYFIPYVGVKYSDVKASAKLTVSGTTYDLGSDKSKNKVGPFVGISFLPSEGSISLDINARFVDEQAVSATIAVKF